MKHIWLVSRIYHEDNIRPVQACPTKAKAKAWVREQDSTLVFTEGAPLLGRLRGHLVARTCGRDWECVYDLERLPFGGEA